MKKTGALGVTTVLGASALLVSGCALPVPLQVASWALDGISLLATEKSVTDHGLSIVAQKDCAIWRGLTDGDVCRQWEGEAETIIAQVAGAKPPDSGEAARPRETRVGFVAVAQSDIPPLTFELENGLPSLDDLANFETAAGVPEPEPESVDIVKPITAMPSLAPLKLDTASAPEPAKPTTKVITKAYTQRVVAKLPPRRLTTAAPAVPPRPAAPVSAAQSGEPAAGIYFVIGSFRNHANARDLAKKFETLVPAVLAAKLDGAPVYRVVVGPVAEGLERTVHRRVSRAGLSDTWAIRVTPGDWMIARSVIDRKRRTEPPGKDAAEVAGLSR